MSQNKLSRRELLIVGDSAETWVAAVAVVRSLIRSLDRDLVRITIVDTAPKNAQYPPFVGFPEDDDFQRFLGVDDKALLASGAAQFSLGNTLTINNTDSSTRGKNKWLCFGDYGFTARGVQFQHIWKRITSEEVSDKHIEYHDFCFSAKLAAENKFCQPQQQGSLMSLLDYGLNYQATAYIEHLKKIVTALSRKITKPDNIIVEYSEVGATSTNNINLMPAENGADLSATDSNRPATLTLNGITREFDLVIDTSYQPLVKENNKKSDTESRFDYDSWPEDYRYTSVEVIAEPSESALVYGEITQSKHACSSSLQFGNTKITTRYADGFQQSLTTATQPYIAAPRKTGQLWRDCYIVMGVAAFGFVPPYISSFNLIQRQLTLFLNLFPNSDDYEICAAEYNRKMAITARRLNALLAISSGSKFSGADNENRRKLISSGDDKPTMTLSAVDEVRHRLHLFRVRGRVAFYEDSLLTESQWATLLIGLGVTIENHDPLLDRLDFDKIKQQLVMGNQKMQQMLTQLPSLNEYTQYVLSLAK